MEIELRMARSEADRSLVFRLRYEILVDELGRNVRFADHDRREVTDPLDETAHLLVAFSGTRPVGTVRINFLREGGLAHLGRVLGMPGEVVRRPSDSSVTSRAAVLASERRGMMFVRLAKATYGYALEHGITADYIVSRPDLRDVYSRLGYRAAAAPATHPEVGEVTPLHLAMCDRDHFDRVRSPFCPILRAFQSSGAAAGR